VEQGKDRDLEPGVQTELGDGETDDVDVKGGLAHAVHGSAGGQDQK